MAQTRTLRSVQPSSGPVARAAPVLAFRAWGDYHATRDGQGFLEFHDFLAKVTPAVGRKANARSVSEHEPTQAAIFYGEATVSPKGVMNLAAEARRDIGLETGGKVLAFGRAGHVILTPVPLADDLLKLALESAAKRPSESKPHG